jgi:hypothetical protein
VKVYRVHALAELFPIIGGEEYQALKADIAEHGQREPVMQLDDGTVIDGRNRLAVCAELGIDPVFATWQPKHIEDTPEAYIVSTNLHRRHLNDAQRALIGARICTHTGPGRKGKPRNDPGEITSTKAAGMMNVHPKMVARARSLIKHAEPERIRAIERGEGKIGAQLGDRKTAKTLPPGGASEVLHAAEAEPEIQREIFDFIERMYDRQPEIWALKTGERMDLLREFAELVNVAVSGIKALDPDGKFSRAQPGGRTK